MKQGSLEERVLARSVLKHIQKKSKSVREGAAVGQDFSDIGGILCADGWHENPELAYIKADNNFSCSGGIRSFVRFFCVLPRDVEEPYIKQYMARLEQLAAEEQVQIAGGQTVVEESCRKPQFGVTMCGIPGQYRQNIKRICPGDAIVMTKDCGLYGTQQLLRTYEQELITRFSGFYIDEARRPEADIRIKAEAEMAALDTENVCYMHDISFGGVYTALWQMSVRMKKGICVEHEKLPIRQETIEICEYFNLNPYMLEGTGALLIVCKDGKKLCRQYQEAGIRASVIGTVADNQDKVIIVGEDTRYLTYPQGDEIHMVKRR